MKNKQLNALGAFENLELFDSKGNRVYRFEAYSNGYWGNNYDNSDDYWCKYTYDSKGKELTYENLDGEKRGFDTPEHTMEELVEKLGYNFKIIKQQDNGN